jgi:hypothetical protein
VTRDQLGLVIAVAVILLGAAAVWLFGAYGLAGTGLVLLVVALLVPIREGEGKP